MTESPTPRERFGFVLLEGWSGLTKTRVQIIGKTPKKLRIRALRADLQSATRPVPVHEIRWVIRSCLDENLMQLHAHAHKVKVIKEWLRSVDSGRSTK